MAFFDIFGQSCFSDSFEIIYCIRLAVLCFFSLVHLFLISYKFTPLKLVLVNVC